MILRQKPRNCHIFLKWVGLDESREHGNWLYGQITSSCIKKTPSSFKYCEYYMRRSYGHHRVKENFNQLYEKIVQLKLPASDGKKYNTDCANTETLFRIIQSIPSPKAEPFKRWLAKVGYE